MNGILLCAQDQGMHFALPLASSGRRRPFG